MAPDILRKISAVIVIIAAVSLASCGYSVRGSGALADGSTGAYRSIAVPMFANDTYEPLIEREVTSALKEEIVYYGRLELVEPEGADLVVKGRVIRVELQPLTFDAAERIQEYRLRIVAEMRVMERGVDKLLWVEPRLESFADYRVTQDVTKSKINKGEAVKKASRNLAEKFIIRVLDIL